MTMQTRMLVVFGLLLVVVLALLAGSLIGFEDENRVTRKFNMSTLICFNALKGDDLDLYAEYTGTALLTLLEEEEETVRTVIDDPDKTYNHVKDVFKKRWNLIWLEPFGFNNAYTLTMRRKQAERLGIETISDLAEYIRADNEETLVAGFDHEFMERPDGYKPLSKEYDFTFADAPKVMDPGMMYKAVEGAEVDVICAFATDGRIPAYDLKVLEDDKGFFPPYYAAPVVRGEVLEKYPRFRDILNQLGGKIDDKTMRQMNFQVDENRRPASEVAREFLIEMKLIAKDDTATWDDASEIKVGAKNFTEQHILGEMMAILIETQYEPAATQTE